MVKIDAVEWGKIAIDGKEYGQVLLVGEEVIERDSITLHQLFGTTHQMSDGEVEKLLEGKPEIIVIGNGWEGAMETSEKLKVILRQGFDGELSRTAQDNTEQDRSIKSQKLGIILKVLRTPEAVEEYNRLVEKGKKVNALIHTTC